MPFNQNSFKRRILAILGCAIAASFAAPQWVLAQTSDANSGEGFIDFQIFEPPPGEGEPRTSAGGGSRNDGTCLDESQFTAVQLDAEEELSDRVALFSVYVPQTSATSLFVNIEDSNRNSVYYDFFSIDGKPGILKVSLPRDRFDLEGENRYYWSVVAICGEDIDPNDPFVSGWVESIDGVFYPIDESLADREISGK